MFHPLKFLRYLFYINLVLLIACSSSGGEGGTGAQDVSVGTITELGSIYVNDIKFDTTSSSVDLDGIAGNDTDLRVGMVVTVKGDIAADKSTGTADEILVKEVLKGPVANNDAVNTFTVLGQTIQVTSATKFDEFSSPDITAIVNGDIVEVSGYVRGDGVISATRVERLGANETQFKVTGTIKNLTTQTMTFELGNLLVDYSTLNAGDLPSEFSNGLFVEVKGSYNTSSLIATEIEKEELDISEVKDMELEGYVTSIISANSFMVNNIPVQVDSNTEFDGGTLQDIVVGIRIEVEGKPVNSVLVADEIEFQDVVNIEAVVETVDSNTGSLTLLGIEGITITTNALTEFEEGLNALDDIESNNVIQIHANPIGGSSVLATNISLESVSPEDEQEVSLQGPVTSILDPNIVILGLSIDTSSFDDSAFELEEQENGRLSFFNTVKTDDIVEVEGEMVGTSIVWTAVSFEN